MKRMLLINLKTYRRGSGENAVRLAKIARRFSGGNAEIILAVQPTEIPKTSGIVKTFSQHIDPVEFGAHTGHILPEDVRQAGAKGTLINHSEDRITIDEIEKSLKRARDVGLTTVVCASGPGMVRKVAKLKPDFIAIEPPELIGTRVSVSRARPGIVRKSVDIVKRESRKTRVLCGAGIHSRNDVSRALELGAHGVLVASAIVKSREPEKTIRDLLEGFG